MKMKVILSLTAVFLSGCSHFVNYPETRAVPESRLGPEYSRFQTPSDNTARVVIARDTGFTGSLVKSSFYVDGEFVAKMYLGESITLYLQPGEHRLGVYQGFSRSPQEHLDEQQLTVKPGETYYYRIEVALVKGWELAKVSLN